MISILYIAPLLCWTAYHYVTNHEINWVEALIQSVAAIFVIILVNFLMMNAFVKDTGIIIGKVEKVYETKYTCDTSWSRSTSRGCRNYDTRQVYVGQTCTRNSDGRQSCKDEYETEYRHDYPWEKDYFVKADVGEVEIERVDDQGARQPPRWSQAYMGEPFAATYTFDNYVKAASSSLFHNDSAVIKNFKESKIFDYYKYNGLINSNNEKDYLRLMQQSSIAGVNIRIYDGDESPEDVWKTMKGGKIYDMIIFPNVPEVRSWSKDDIVNVKIRDLIALDDNWMNSMGNVIKKYYVKPSDEDFEYLVDDLSIPWWGHVILMIFLIGLGPALTIFLSNNDMRK